MRFGSALSLLCCVSASVAAQTTPLRPVTNGTLVSGADPAASFVIDPAFTDAGGQIIDILKVAGAEQHFFIAAGPGRSIERFYWVQFEHYYPDNDNHYDYSGIKQTPIAMGRMTLAGDVRIRASYFTMDDRPGSDSKAAERYLRARGYNLDGTFVTLRMFALTDSTRRRELMVIYGEALPRGGADSSITPGIIARAKAGLHIQ